MRALVVESQTDLASPPEALWPLLVDTDRLNRALGMKPVRYRPVPSADAKTGARLLAETIMGGLTVTYEELPFEWTYGRQFSVRRLFVGGPFESMRVAWSLAPGSKQGGTTLSVVIEILPRAFFLRPLAWLGAKSSIAEIVRLGERIDAHVHDGAKSPFLEPVSASDAEAIERCVHDLEKRGVRQTLARRLGDFVGDAPDADCVRMRPFELADLWKEDRRELLVAFLYGVLAGLVELRWSIVCPSCRTQAATVPALEDVPPEGHCQMCDIAFELDLDRAVEAVFVPSPAVRHVPAQMFCIAGPARTPHVLCQVNVPGREHARLSVPARAGRYRLFARGGARASLEVCDGGAETAELRLGDDTLEPATVSVRPDGVLDIASASDETRHVKIEHLEYANTAATAHELATLAEFRGHFSTELLKRGTPLKVARAAVLFTDLTGSTALYSSLGDAAAFRFVDDHFDVLRKAIADTGGAVVKTMGDAVMGAWCSDTACLRGALACLDRFEELRKASPNGTETRLKLGLYCGACYVITANGVLDYFGQTVNVASRLQHLAEGGEIVLEAKMLDLLAEKDRNATTASAPFETHVKGVRRVLQLVRLTRKSRSVVGATPCSAST